MACSRLKFTFTFTGFSFTATLNALSQNCGEQTVALYWGSDRILHIYWAVHSSINYTADSALLNKSRNK
jgi:hypothetical protein